MESLSIFDILTNVRAARELQFSRVAEANTASGWLFKETETLRVLHGVARHCLEVQNVLHDIT